MDTRVLRALARLVISLTLAATAGAQESIIYESPGEIISHQPVISEGQVILDGGAILHQTPVKSGVVAVVDKSVAVHKETAGQIPPESPPTKKKVAAKKPNPRVALRLSPVVPEPSAEATARREASFRDLADQVSELELRSRILRRVAKLARPSVVHIDAAKSPSRASKKDRNAAMLHDNPIIEEAGAGVVIRFDKKLYVLTNRHVIRDCSPQNIRVTLADGRVTYPVSIRSDPSTDVALIEIDAQGAIPARTGNSDEVETGDYVLAFGSPFGLSHTVTHGIISATGRRDLTLGTNDVTIQDFIQTDAAINPGNSGGPLFNMRGEVIGINTAIASDSGVNAGIGFAIPVNIAKFIGAQLVIHGRVRPCQLGVRLDAKFDYEEAAAAGLPQHAGAKVLRVGAGSNALAAGLRPGDVVFEYDGTTVEDDSHLVKLVGLTPLNKDVAVTVYRDGKPMHVVVHMRPTQDTAVEISRRKSKSKN